MSKQKSDRTRLDRFVFILVPFVAVVAALAVGAIILLLQDVSPITAYTEMITGAFTNKNGLADTMVKAIPLLLVALGVAIAFRGGVINIGAEGQLIMGALFTTYVGLQLGDRLPGAIVIVICLLAGMFMGGVWGAIPGYLKARMGVNEILSTIMMNQIAIQIGFFLLRGPMIDPAELEAGTNIPHSARLARSTDLPRFTDIAQWLGINKSAEELGLTGFVAEVYGLFVEPTRLHFGLIIAIIMAILVYIFFVEDHYRLSNSGGWSESCGLKVRWD